MTRRIAAALMITRGQGRDLTVFLAERSAELRFFGGYWALPGGTVGDEDRTGDADLATALQRCAHRELFEEVRLLRHELPHGRQDEDLLRRRREELLQHERASSSGPATGPATSGPAPTPGESPWPRIIAGATEPLPLRELCRIETPPFAPVRYDTVFFHVPLEGCVAGTGGHLPDVWPGELQKGRFWLPQQALASWRNGDLLLVPPVVILLEHLARAADFEHFAREIGSTAASYQRGRLHQVRFSPGIVLAPLETPTLPPATTTNCYVVGNEQLWVVDPGSPNPSEQQRLLELLDELTGELTGERTGETNAAGRRLAGVLLTHHHPDHTGGALALCEARGLRVAGHRLTLDRIGKSIPRGAVLDEGDVVPLGNAPDGQRNWHLRVLHTPGHDRGHLCFRESRYGAMLVGDMLSTVSTIIVDPPEGHLATYLQSLERLSTQEISTLYPAHGPALRDGERLVQKYLRHRRQREAALLKALREAAGTLEQLLPKVYWDADPRLYPFAARSLQAGLDKLAEEGLAAPGADGQWHATADA